MSKEAMQQLPKIRVEEYINKDAIFLRFIDRDTETPVTQRERYETAAYFFAHFAFQEWNASQVKVKSLQRRNIAVHSGILLLGEDLLDGEIELAASYLIEAYDEASDPEDNFTDRRVEYVQDIVHTQLARERIF